MIDATNVQRPARKRLLAIAAETGEPAAAIVLNLPLETCLARNRERLDRQVAPEVVERQVADLSGSLRRLKAEGFVSIYILDNVGDIDSAPLFREPLREPLREQRNS